MLAATRGGGKDRNGNPLNLTVKRGQSYYTGDPLNKSLVSPERFEAILDAVKREAKAETNIPIPLPNPKPEPVAKSKRFWTWLTAAALPALGLLDWRVQLASVVICGGLAVYAIYSMPQVKAKFAKLVDAL